ncbi:MAG: hypothetical protein RJA07_1388 [Bacteroidota bacterium]
MFFRVCNLVDNKFNHKLSVRLDVLSILQLDTPNRRFEIVNYKSQVTNLAEQISTLANHHIISFANHSFQLNQLHQSFNRCGFVDVEHFELL